MIIAITSLKGGVGKSTISQNLAVCFAHMGYRVAIIDTDTNASSVHWSGIRSEDHPPITVMGITDSNALRKNIRQVEENYDMVLIDGTPAISKLVSTILILGDLVLIPIRPSGLDIWATEKFMEHFDQARSLKEHIQARFLLNEFNPKVNLNRDIQKALDELEIGTLQATLRHRIAYEEACVMGLGVYEYRDTKAKREVTQLTNEVLDLLKAL
ncbi:MAG: ParA family partition ATPase [Bacteroidota bacterium]